ncbi:SPRY incomplete domain containing protein [Pandoravirus dulcis]|uniref:SPRY incomplete domain containing protein n=1 Tax=Pandoravirus dulcis TaxID=1349409 RepID=S4VTP1_9VIRU|nr:SPRY incomplete domain containing protein [Pandoravirus dulcis]AGO82790.1 SPRY incomplete domain containing protein [Pandoravirus dulcis]
MTEGPNPAWLVPTQRRHCALCRFFPLFVILDRGTRQKDEARCVLATDTLFFFFLLFLLLLLDIVADRHAMPHGRFSTRTRSRIAAAGLCAVAGVLAAACIAYGPVDPIMCVTALLVAAGLWATGAMTITTVPCADPEPTPATATATVKARSAGSRTQDDTGRPVAATIDGRHDAFGDSSHAATTSTPSRVVATRAAHSTGRHEASYVVATPCFVGVREAVGTALGDIWPRPDLALLSPSGHLVYRHNGEIDTTSVALPRPLATDDTVTVRLDADAGRVLFTVNGDHAGPPVPLLVGGAYAFVATDPATASTISMIADRR